MLVGDVTLRCLSARCSISRVSHSDAVSALPLLRCSKDRAKAWDEYRDTITQLYYRQLLYLFVHGNNRWEAHEVAHMEQMTEWLLDGGVLPPPSETMKERLANAMTSYKQDWEALPRERRDTADDQSVDYLLRRIDQWQSGLRRSTHR